MYTQKKKMKPSQIVSFKAVLNQEIQFDDKNEVCLDNLSIDELNNKVEMYNKLFLENVIISDHLYSSSAFIGYEGPSMFHTASFISLYHLPIFLGYQLQVSKNPGRVFLPTFSAAYLPFMFYIL